MICGQSYPVSVTMKNTDRSTWIKASGYKLGSQNPRDNKVWGFSRVELSDAARVGGVRPTTTFTFNVTAPAKSGTYNFQWRMVQEGVEWFGGSTPNVAVVVSQ